MLNPFGAAMGGQSDSGTQGKKEKKIDRGAPVVDLEKQNKKTIGVLNGSIFFAFRSCARQRFALRRVRPGKVSFLVAQRCEST